MVRKFAHGDSAYELNPDLDVDLAPTGAKVQEAVEEAVRLINRHTSLSLTLADFDQKVYAVAYHSNHTSKNEPVGWKCVRESTVDGQKGAWHIEISIDDPTVSAAVPRGPKCPHVGYEFYFRSPDGGSTSKKTGHVMILSTPASRPRPSEARRDPRHTGRS